MTSDILDLLDRSLSRAREEHVSVLITVLNEAVSVIHPTRRATVPESLKLFEKKTFLARKDYFSQVRQAVLSVVEGTNAGFTSEDISAVLALVGKYVESSLYLARFTAYEGAVARHVARFGSPFQLSHFRVDLTKATYEVSSVNSIRSFLAALSDDLEIVALKQKNSSASVGAIKPFTWYGELSTVEKIGLWGSIASIVGLALVFMPPSASSQGEEKPQATTYGSKSPAIGSNQGNVTINYGGDSVAREKSYVLRNSSGGATLVVSKPSLDSAQYPKDHVCMAPAGTPVELTGESAKMGNIDMWRKIRIGSGECANKSGWVAISNVSVE